VEIFAFSLMINQLRSQTSVRQRAHDD